MSHNKSTTILGIDPGYGIVGFGVITINDSHQMKHVTHGVITTPSKSEFISRIHIISQDLIDIIKKYKPDAVGIEKIFFAKNTKTAIDVAQARGAILATIAAHNVPIFELTPLQVKQGIVGYGKADKIQVQKMTQYLMGLTKIPKPDDAADALAIAVAVSTQVLTRRLKGV
ncbi:crossover junction endodeoxyribonuclease RuvC [Candidatus Falkowbacteria bacterium]|nr:crossover junction endodeoxyribonuclease RuvC [Candidatus Falkowbacteria bacterium]